MWSDGLDGAALQVARNTASPLRVIAGPGSGKTFALMRRVARLLEEGADPQKVLVCTFTRTAAEDLERELARFGTPGMDNVDAGTLHALCFRVLGTGGFFESTGRTPRPLMDFEQRFLLEDLKSPTFGDYWAKRRRLRAFNAAWSRLQAEDPGWPVDEVDQLFNAQLGAWLHFHAAMLIGEVVPRSLAYLRDNPLALAIPKYDHVLVDEYQDLNRAEQALINLLARAGTITVVGDEDQSIYSFKHAHREGIAEFVGVHPGTHDEHLIVCRRCPSEVVNAANALIANNATRSNRVLVPMADQISGDIHAVQWLDVESEAEGLAAFIRARIDSQQTTAGRVLVLAPRREFGYAIRDALITTGIQARSFFSEQELDGNPKHLHESEAQQAFTLLTLLARPDDATALRVWCGFGSDSLNEPAWARLRKYVNDAVVSVRVALEQIRTGEVFIPYTNTLKLKFQSLVEREAGLKELGGQALLDNLFPTGEEWAEPFRTLAASTIEEDAGADAETLLRALRQGVTQPELPTTVDYVRVMSLHKSKGLTADLVIIAGCVQGLIPSTFNERQTELSQADFLEEQRRLLFVGVTRTTRSLVLSSTATLPIALARKWRLPVMGYLPEGRVATRASELLAGC